MLKYVMPSIQHRGVNTIDDLRVKMAENQWEKFQKQKENNQSKDKKEIVQLVNKFLEMIGISINPQFDNEVKPKNTTKGRVSYSGIKEESGISCKEDIVWIKFNENGCISVIGVGCDIHFTPKAKAETSAGKINKFLEQKYGEKQEWDEKSVLVFPLINLDNMLDFNRSDIESGIGNYLLANDVPILDYYSHMY